MFNLAIMALAATSTYAQGGGGGRGGGRQPPAGPQTPVDTSTPPPSETSPTVSPGTLRAQTDEERSAFEAAMDTIFTVNGQFQPETDTPLLLRIAFHDAGTYIAADDTGGPNASVQFELDSDANVGRVANNGWPIVLSIQAALVGTAAETFSLADIVALAPAYGLEQMGGGTYTMQVGRVDATAEDPDNDEGLPEETDSLAQLEATFGKSGFSTREIVVLSGSHAIGVIPGVGGNADFSNAYYTALLSDGTDGEPLASDTVLVDNAATLPVVQELAGDGDLFLGEFRDAYIKLMNLGYSSN